MGLRKNPMRFNVLCEDHYLEIVIFIGNYGYLLKSRVR